MPPSKYAPFLTIVVAGLDALGAVGAAADSVLGRSPTLEEALAVLSGISGVANSIMRGLENPDDSVAAIEGARVELERTIAGNNQAIDADVDAKFPKVSPSA